MTAFIRTSEVALRRYEETRLQLQRSADEDSLVQYLRGCDDMELTLIALHRAMRVAEALKTSRETNVSSAELPSAAERDQLRKMRNAIDHVDEPILGGRAGIGQTLALHVREDDVMIDHKDGPLTATHSQVGGWVQRLHGLAVNLTNHPGRWARS